MTTASAAEPVLRVAGLGVRFGGVQAVADVSFEVGKDEIVGVIGPNGAGKTTLFNAISGLVRGGKGEVWLGAAALHGLPPHRIASLGLARTFQNIRLFRSLSVIDNVLVGAHQRMRESMFDSAFHTPRYRSAERQAALRAQRILAFVGLGTVPPGAAANSLPYGDQRRLEIARALASEPRLLLLDEPAAGMNTAESLALAAVIRRIRGSGTAVLLVEHDMRVVMSVCDRIMVLNFGRSIATGSPDQIQTDPAVVAAYLGEPEK
ncbi:MAG: ABC transporter ATP-binding protein [Candidatus Dormibacteria bacterium]